MKGISASGGFITTLVLSAAFAGEDADTGLGQATLHCQPHAHPQHMQLQAQSEISKWHYLKDSLRPSNSDFIKTKELISPAQGKENIWQDLWEELLLMARSYPLAGARGLGQCLQLHLGAKFHSVKQNTEESVPSASLFSHRQIHFHPPCLSPCHCMYRHIYASCSAASVQTHPHQHPARHCHQPVHRATPAEPQPQPSTGLW